MDPPNDEFYEDQAVVLVKQKNYADAIESLDKISSIEKRLDSTFLCLVGLATLLAFEQRGTDKISYRINPETGKLEGLDKIIQEVVPENHVLRKYYAKLERASG